MDAPEDNPYRAPDARVSDLVVDPREAKSERERHLETESWLRVLGGLSVLCGGVLVAGCIGRLIAPRAAAVGAMDLRWLIFPPLALFGFFGAGVGLGLALFRGWARIAATFVCLIGGLALLAEAGSASGWVSYLLGFASLALFWVGVALLGGKARTVCSARYREVIEATQSVKRSPSRTAIAGVVVVAFFGGVLLLGLVR